MRIRIRAIRLEAFKHASLRWLAGLLVKTAEAARAVDHSHTSCLLIGSAPARIMRLGRACAVGRLAAANMFPRRP